MIPKIIHYCWLSGDPIPEKLKKYMESWKKHLPDYEFMLWDLERFDIHQTLWTQQAFAAKKYAFAADYIRLYAIYMYGGIYMDMDVEVVKPFENLLQQNFILGFESNNQAIEAGIIGGEKGAEWLAAGLNYYKERSFVQSDNSYDIKPLPYILYSILIEQFPSYLSKVVSYDFFTAKSLSTGEIVVTKNTYTIHHFEGTWLPRSKRIKKVIKRFLGVKLTTLVVRMKHVISKN